MDVAKLALNEAGPLLSREIFGNVSNVSKLVFYAMAFVAIVSFCIGIYRRSGLWKPGVKQPGQGFNGAFLRRIVSDVLLQRRMLGRLRATLKTTFAFDPHMKAMVTAR